MKTRDTLRLVVRLTKLTEAKLSRMNRASLKTGGARRSHRRERRCGSLCGRSCVTGAQGSPSVEIDVPDIEVTVVAI